MKRGEERNYVYIVRDKGIDGVKMVWKFNII